MHARTIRFAPRCLRAVITLVPALFGSACHIGYDFRGPGYDRASGKVKPTVPDTVVVAVTTGEVASGRSRAFFRELDAVLQDLTAREGLVGYALRKRTFGSHIWTLSAWVDDASLDAFLESEAHRRAVREGGIPSASVRYVRVPMPATSLPLSWDAAVALLPSEPQ